MISVKLRRNNSVKIIKGCKSQPLSLADLTCDNLLWKNTQQRTRLGGKTLLKSAATGDAPLA